MNAKIIVGALLVLALCMPTASAVPTYSVIFIPLEDPDVDPIWVAAICRGGYVYDQYLEAGDYELGYYDNDGQWNKEGSTFGFGHTSEMSMPPQKCPIPITP